MHTTIDDLMETVRAQRGLDLRRYRRDALARRVALRMRAVGVQGVAEYRARLDADPQELDVLIDTALAPTPGLFRDGSLVDELAREVIPALARSDGGERRIVVWSARCGAGQEPYALAMLFAEALGPAAFRQRVEILATDPDADALATARAAVYDEREVQAVPAGLRSRYFVPAAGALRVRRDLCARVRFLWADLTDGPPASAVDLLCCRDALVHVGQEDRDRLLPTFRRALDPDGVLVLGRRDHPPEAHHGFAGPAGRRRYVPRREGAGDPAPVSAPREEPPVPDDATLRLMAAAMEVVPDAVVIVGSAGVLHAANRSARRLLGLHADDLGASWAALIAHRSLAGLEDAVAAVARDRQEVRVPHVHVQDPAGTARDLEGVALPMPSSCVPPPVCVLLRDISRQLRREAELREADRDLHALLDELAATMDALDEASRALPRP